MKIIFTLSLTVIVSHFAAGQWSTNPAVNNAICTGVNQQQGSRIVSDGNNGAIICWNDYIPADNENNIYAQRVSSTGSILWAIDGVAICTELGPQTQMEATSDGNGGAIIAWQDNRVFTIPQIYIQRVDGNGVVQWATNGISLGDGINGNTQPQLVSDGNGGAIITWKIATTTNSRIFAQRVDASGNLLWASGGIPMSTSLAPEQPRIISDNAGGAIIAWNQYVGTFPNGNHDIYTQRVDGAGNILWGATGTVLTTAPSHQTNAQLTTDGGNGAIVVWPGPSSSPGANLFAQKLNALGVIQWPLEGIAIAPGTLNQVEHKVSTDGAGGAFITWSANNAVYVQRIGTAGNLLWGAIGLRISVTTNSRFPQITTDGSTGAIASWYTQTTSNVLAQRINQAGVIQWQANGVFVSNESNSDQVDQRMLAITGGSTIVVWMDFRNSATNFSDIYASLLKPDGTLGVATVPVKFLNFTADELNNSVQLRWQTATEQNSRYYDVERSEDGKLFTSIGMVNAAGNSQTIKSYSFTDASPLKGINFYRLKQVDADARYLYSAIIKTGYNKSALFTISPNPAHDFIHITNPGSTEMVSIRIYDISGKIVNELTIKNHSPIYVDVHALQPGMYFIRLSDGKTTQQSRFIKK